MADDRNPSEELRVGYQQLTDEADPARRVGWPARWMQWLAFEMLAGVADLNGRVVLDAGCGLGDLLPYLQSNGWQGTYVGIDVVPELLNEAKNRHPGEQFVLANLLTDDIPPCDYALAGGLFDYRLPDSASRMRLTLERLFERVRCGLAWTIFIAPGSPEMSYSEPPGDLLAVCKGLTPWVIMRSDANLNLATFYLYKRAHFVDANVEQLIGRLALNPEERTLAAARPEKIAEEHSLNARQLSFLARLFWHP